MRGDGVTSWFGWGLGEAAPQPEGAPVVGKARGAARKLWVVACGPRRQWVGWAAGVARSGGQGMGAHKLAPSER